MSKNVSHHNMVNGHCIIMFLFRLKLFLILPEVGRILVLNRQKVVELHCWNCLTILPLLYKGDWDPFLFWVRMLSSCFVCITTSFRGWRSQK